MAAPLLTKFRLPYFRQICCKCGNALQKRPGSVAVTSVRDYPSVVNQDPLNKSAPDDEEYDLSGRPQHDKLYPGHIPITPLQRGLLAAGSAAMALFNPRRDDMVAICGEATAHYSLTYIQKKMQADPVGQQILREQPKINKNTVNLDALRNLPDNTFGKAYVNWMDARGFDPDARRPVHFVDDPELAYIMLRYRQCHDLIHTLVGMKPDMQGEVAVKWFEALQTGLPMCIGAAVFGPIRFGPKQRQRYIEKYWSWAVKNGYNAKFYMNVYYEKEWEKPLDQLRQELNIEPPP